MLLFCVDRFTAIVLWYKYRIDETLMVLSAKLLAWNYTLWTQDVTWMYIRYSEDVQDVF